MWDSWRTWKDNCLTGSLRCGTSTNVSKDIIFIEVIVVSLRVRICDMSWVLVNLWVSFRRQGKGPFCLPKYFIIEKQQQQQKPLSKNRIKQFLSLPVNACQSSDFSSWISELSSIWSHLTWLILYATACQRVLVPNRQVSALFSEQTTLIPGLGALFMSHTWNIYLCILCSSTLIL